MQEDINSAFCGESESLSKDMMHTMENIAQGNMSEINHHRRSRWAGASAGSTNWFVWSPPPILNLRQLESFHGCAAKLLLVCISCGLSTNWISTSAFALASWLQVLGKAVQILLRTSDRIIKSAQFNKQCSFSNSNNLSFFWIWDLKSN